jgi:hypothetical protein
MISSFLFGEHKKWPSVRHSRTLVRAEQAGEHKERNMTKYQRLMSCSAAEQTTEQAEHRASVRLCPFLRKDQPNMRTARTRSKRTRWRKDKMMFVLVSGSLWRDSIARQAKNEKQFTTPYEERAAVEILSGGLSREDWALVSKLYWLH